MKKVKILKKEYIGVDDVYDIEVKDTHHYILKNGIVSHNSGLKYFSSVILYLQKSKAKDDSKVQHGVYIRVKSMKNRLAKEEKSIKCLLDYNTGLHKFYGLQGERKTEKSQTLKNFCAPMLVKNTISGKKWTYKENEIDNSDLIREELWTDDLLELANENMIKYMSYGMGEELEEESDGEDELSDD